MKISKKKSKETPGNDDLNSWFICPKCKSSIPLISQFYSEEEKKWLLEIRCSCIKDSFLYMDIHEFLKLKSNPKNIKEILFKNYLGNSFDNKGKTKFCEKCEKILTNDELEEHKDHPIIDLVEEAAEIDKKIGDIDSDFYKVQQNFEINNNIAKLQQIDLIDEEIEKLKEMKEKIEIAYKQNQEINNFFIDYVQIIINNYKNARKLDDNLVNYNILKNLINNTEFNMNKFEVNEKNILETSNKLCSFYKNNFIIRRKFNSLELEQEIHSKKNINIVYKISRDVFAMGEGGKSTKNQSYDIFIYERDKSNNEYKLVKTIEKAHSGEITSLCKVMINNNEYLLSGDTGDKLINVYDIQNNFKKVMYLSGHKRKIVNIISLNKINEYKNWIASCSTGLNIKLWDLSEIQSLLSENGNNDNSEPIKGPEIAYSIKGHIKSLKCLYLMSDGTLISNGGDKKLKFWDVDKKACTKIFDDICVSSTNSICELDNSRIIVGCFNVIKIINVCNLTVENELIGHEVWINCLCITPDGLLYSGDSEGVLSLWEISGEGKKIYTEKKNSAIKTIDLLSEDKIIVGLINSCVDILKYK